MSRTEFADRLDGTVSRNTVIRAFAGHPIRIRTARDLAKALRVASLEELLPEDDSTAADQPEYCGEWEVTSQLSGWITEANGLQYRICRLQHRFIADRPGRGKEYDLQNPVTRERERIEHYLCRHAAVSEKLRGDPHFAETLNTFPAADRQSWWVVDRLIEGTTLQARLQSGPLARPELAHVMKGVLDSLEALHRAGIVFRELAPRRVLLAQADDRVLLTDFELARLLDSQHSVSTSWPDGPYRAPELASGPADFRVDIYSWARLLLEAATGSLPPPGGDQDALLMAGLPKTVWRVAADCLSPFPQDRPPSVARVRRALSRWR